MSKTSPTHSLKDGLNFLGGAISAGNQFSRENQELFMSGLEGQNPYLIAITCSDSRVQIGIYDADDKKLYGQIFEAEDIGNGENSAEAAIDYAVNHLNVPVVWYLGHTACGAMAAASSDYSGETGAIKGRLDKFKSIVETVSDESGDCNQTSLSVANVDRSVEATVNKYKKKIDKGELAVIGSIVDTVGRIDKTKLNETYTIRVNNMIEKGEIDKFLKDMYGDDAVSHFNTLDRRVLQ